MGIITFAAIDIGSYEVGMKIFELTKKGMKEIDFIRHRIELGKDTYVLGKIGCELSDELCDVLKEFQSIMNTYQVHAYRACATSAIREAENSLILLDKIRLKTGLKVEILSNSEQRFIRYKSIAYKEEKFESIIQNGTAIVDVGGGSIQISLYDKDKLVTTQNIRLGSLRIREKLSGLERYTTNVHTLIDELADNELHNFKKLYLKDRSIKNIIAVGDYITYIMKQANSEQNVDSISSKEFIAFYNKLCLMTPEKIAVTMGISSDSATLVMPSAIIYKRMIEETGAEFIWTPGIKLSDGIAYDYAEKNEIIKVKHNFENDILAAAKNIGKRYINNKTHTEILNEISLKIFDSIVRVHGMGKRERLLLQIAVILHDCGKYISLSQAAECSYNIIMSTEIIGLSHLEREIIANVVKFNTTEFVYYAKLAGKMDKDSYMLVAKLTAILRVGNALDRSHKQKFKNVKASLSENELLITVETMEDITLEKGLFQEKAEFFEEVYSILPVIKQKKVLR